jgi:palmitoyltransferase
MILACAVMMKARVVRLSLASLFYNEHMSVNYAFDTLLEPIFWLVDHFTGVLGPAFVTAVVGLTGSVVVIAYGIGLPYYWSKNPLLAVLLVTSGQFFFVNIVFNYWMALRTGPGRPPNDATKLTQVTAICKKCIAPKPPRTHHCSV